VVFAQNHHIFLIPRLIFRPVQRDVQVIFAGNRLRGDIAFDGNRVFSVFDVINIANEKDIGNSYARKTFSNLIKVGAPHEAFIKRLGIYEMRTDRGNTPAMTWKGLKSLLPRLPGKVADEYIEYAAEITTRYEAGDFSPTEMHANKTSSNMMNSESRQSMAHQAASVGPSLAAPPKLVRGNWAYTVRSCLCVMLYCFDVVTSCPCATMPLLTDAPAGAGSGRSRC